MAKIKKSELNADDPDVEEIDDDAILDRDEKHFDNEDIIAMDEFSDHLEETEEFTLNDLDEEEDDAESEIDEIFDELDDEDEEDLDIDEDEDLEDDED